MKYRRAIRIRSFCIFTLSLVYPSLQAEEQGAGLKAELKAKIEVATASEDWKQVERLSKALQNLEATLGKKPSPSEPKEKKPAKPGEDAIKNLVKSGFHLSLAPQDDNPAKFSFSRNIQTGEGAKFGADFFLEWNLPNSLAEDWGLHGDNYAWKFGASVEGKLKSTDNMELDAWRFRVTANRWDFFNRDDSTKKNDWGLSWTLSLKEEANRDFDFSRLSGELTVTPTWAAAAIGVFQPGPVSGSGADLDLPPVQFRWRPFIGIDAGGIVDGVQLAKGEEFRDPLWLVGRVTAKVRLNSLAKALNFNEISIFGDGKIVYLNESEKWRTYLKTGINFMLNDYAGFSIDYSVGKDSPKFQQEKLLEGAFTLKF